MTLAEIRPSAKYTSPSVINPHLRILRVLKRESQPAIRMRNVGMIAG
jgi:hypothetical protein